MITNEFYQLKKIGGLFDFLQKNYELTRNQSPCCLLEFHDWKNSEYSIAQENFRIVADGKARWLLQRGYSKVATCTRTATGPQAKYNIRCAGRSWDIKFERRGLKPTHIIYEGGQHIGLITAHIGFWWSHLTAETRVAIPVEIVAFAIWLVGIHWIGIAGKLVAGRAEIGI